MEEKLRNHLSRLNAAHLVDCASLGLVTMN
jgi:hypothetical protein